MKLSPFVTKKSRNARPATAGKKAARPLDKKTGAEIPQQTGKIPNGIALDKLLIDKFPGFDPSWPDEVKLKWFAAFDELLKRTGG
jgi:hypothetical protein